MDKTPLEKKDENYPTILNTATKRKQENTTDQNQTEEPTIISKTQIIPETQTMNSSPHTPTNDAQQPELPKSNTPAPKRQEIINTQIQISSLALVSNRFRLLTPDTPPTNNETDHKILTPRSPTPKTKRQIRLEARLFKAKKFTRQLQATDFFDTNNLNNAIKQEKVNILGTYDPSTNLSEDTNTKTFWANTKKYPRKERGNQTLY